MNETILDRAYKIDLKPRRRELLPIWYQIIHLAVLGLFSYGFYHDILRPIIWTFNASSNQQLKDYFRPFFIAETLFCLGPIITCIGFIFGYRWAPIIGIPSMLFGIVFMVAAIIHFKDPINYKVVVIALLCAYLFYSYLVLRKKWVNAHE